MNGPATTTVTIYRGIIADEWGDDEQVNAVPVATNIPASIIEQSFLNNNPVTGIPRTVRKITARLSSTVDVVDTDRIVDERTNLTYTVDARHLSTSGVRTPDIRLDLTHVD
jgi:hypothetical protein